MLALHLRMQALGIQPRFLINLNAENIGIRYFCLCFGGFPHRKVRIIRLMKHQCADAGFGIHHHPFGELHANIFRFQKPPDPGLVLKVRARRITETVALAAVARSKPLSDGQFGWVGETPVLTNPLVQPLCAGLRRFNRQRLQSAASCPSGRQARGCVARAAPAVPSPIRSDCASSGRS
jgi:hypothetical protein